LEVLKDSRTGWILLGLLTLGVSALIALDQKVTYGRWEIEQTLTPFHHESAATMGLVLGTALIGIAAIAE